MPSCSRRHPVDPDVSRAQNIFKASENVKPFDPADFAFAMDDDFSIEVGPAAAPVSLVQPQAASSAKKQTGRVLGMTPLQLVILGGLALALLCIVAGFAYYLLDLAWTKIDSFSFRCDSCP